MKKSTDLRKKRKGILLQIQEMPLWVNGSVVETTKKYRGKEIPFYYLSRSVKGKNKVVYISAKNLDAFKEASVNGVKIKALLAELGDVNVALIKATEDND